MADFRPIADGRDPHGNLGAVSKFANGVITVPTGGTASCEIDSVPIYIQDFRVRCPDEPGADRHKGGAAFHFDKNDRRTSFHIGPEGDGKEFRLPVVDALAWWSNDQPLGK